ncbi:MAG: hypothetical protein IKH90_06940, partial [Ruminococcus sp.]|nr:hypothetical protein [Ruminococcus sp.]
MDTSWRITYSWSNLGCIKSVFGSKRLIDTERKKEENKMIVTWTLLGGSLIVGATLVALNQFLVA